MTALFVEVMVAEEEGGKNDKLEQKEGWRQARTQWRSLQLFLTQWRSFYPYWISLR